MRIWAFLLGIVLFVAACFGLILFSPALANTFSDRVSFRDITWSPDGNKVAFLADIHTDTTSDFFYTLYVVDADGKHLKKVTGGGIDENINSFAWSPDGKTLAVIDGVPAEVSLYNLNGEKTETIELDGSASGIGWSPDGTQLAVLTNLDNTHRISLVDDDDTHQIYSGADAAFSRQLYWSPDGQQILFGDSGSLIVVDTATGQFQIPVQNYLEGMMEIHWSNDSQKVIFSNVRGIYEVEANGGEIEKIGDAPEYQAGVMSPEGELQAKVGCGDENQADESNIDIFPCNFYEIHIMRDAEVVAKVGIEDLKAIGGGSGLTWRGFTILLVVVLLIAPAMTLPYAILHHHWVSKLFVVLVMTFYLLVCGIVLVDVLVL